MNIEELIHFSKMTLIPIIVTYNPFLEYWQAQMQKIEVKEGSCVLSSTWGAGCTPDAAIKDYANRIRGKLLIYDAYGKNRKEFHFPE